MAGEYSRFPELREQDAALTELAASLVKPFTLAVFGYMKTGKSTLINALVGRPLAITGTDETTATLNWISYGDSSQKDTMLIHWKNGQSEPLPLSRLVDWTGKSEEALARVRETLFLQLYAEVEKLRDIQIVDTPGIGAVVGEHTEAATSILSSEEGRKADALLYVFPSVAKALDVAKLRDFRKTRLPNSDPYNSIGVLHKWDGLEAHDPFAEAAKKATKLYTGTPDEKGLEDLVCDIIPVSAPLALAARCASDEFFAQLIDLLKKGYSSDWLLASELWDEDADRRSARKIYSEMPWVSFTLLIRILITKSPGTVSEAKKLCLEASGIERLEKELDRRFFLNAAIIKQRLTRVKAMEPINRGVLFFNERIELLARDERHFRDLVAETPKGNKHAAWLADKHSLMGKERSELEEIAENANRICFAEEERMNLLEKDLEFLEQMDKKPEFVEKSDAEWIRSLLRQNSVSGESGVIPREVLKSMIDRYQHQLQGPVKRIKELFAHLICRIQERLREV
jgi:GTPase SAR1 family protein